MAKRVLHLVGSATGDFYAGLSRLYARDCLSATASPAYEFHVAYVTPDRRWRFPSDLSDEAIAAATPVSLENAVQRLTALEPEVMVPQMFDLPGMTHYRALFDLLEIPYLGNVPDVMALGADKAKARGVVAAAGVCVPEGELLSAGEPPTLVPPAVVKPVDTDNSFGLTLVRQFEAYPAALETAFAYSDRVLVERYIEGREVRCGVIVRDGSLVCLPLEEYSVGPEKPIRHYDDKVGESASGALNLVAKDRSKAWIVAPDDPITPHVWDAARRCHTAFGCRHYSLFDFRVDAGGQPWFLEAGLYCSFARQSVVSVMARAAGISLEELFGLMIRNATEV